MNKPHRASPRVVALDTPSHDFLSHSVLLHSGNDQEDPVRRLKTAVACLSHLSKEYKCHERIRTTYTENL